MAVKYASLDLYNKFENVRTPVSSTYLRDRLGLKSNATDDTSYTKAYSIESERWLQEISSSFVSAIFYDSTDNKYHFRPGALSPVSGQIGGWFTLDEMSSAVYFNNNSRDRMSLSNTVATVYKLSDSSVVPAVSFVDPSSNTTKYLIRPDYITSSMTKCGWYTETELNDLGFSLTQPIIPKEFGGSFADNSSIALTLDLVGDTLLKNHLLRKPSITPFSGELVIGGNLKKAIPPSEEGDYGYMDLNRDFNMSDIETGYVGKPTVFYSSTLSEQTGTWGTIQLTREIKGYLRGAAYQTSNKSLSANSSNYLYPEGESSFLAGDSSKTYTLIGAYTNNGTSVSITGCSVAVISGNLKLEWGSTAANVCYVTIEES